MSKIFITSIASVCILSLFSFVNKSSAQGVVNFADANFKAALVGNRAINRNGDGEIQTSEAVAFKGIMNVGGLSISNLQGVEAFTNITGLYCNDNNLNSLNINANTKLSVLRCDHNQLATLNVSANTALTDLRCNVNSISSLNVSANSQLKVLWAFQNPLQTLSTIANTQLTQLIVSFTNLSTLDVSANHALTYLDVRKTPLKSLNVKNGNNTNFTYFDALQSPALLCIQVDNPAYSQTNWRNVEPRVIFSTDCGAANTDIVNIPDANLKTVLVRSRINKNGDSEIQVSEAASYNEEIFAPSKNITDLTGIEAFTSLTELHIYDNPITTLNLSKNTALRVLKVEDTKITTLDVRANTNLKALYCQNLPLTSLDLSQNANLEVLWCFGNKLTSLDVSGSPKLRYLQCNHNQLTTLTLGSKPALTNLLCYANQLSSLDLSSAPTLLWVQCNLNKITSINLNGATQLNWLYCHDNLLESVDFSMNPNLRSVSLTKNRLDSLDLSNNTKLEGVSAETNKLRYFNIKNGNNRIIRNFNAKENPQLTCIEVDDPAYSKYNWTMVDSQATFSVYCSNGGNSGAVVYIPDPNFKSAMLELVDGGLDGNPDGEVQYREAAELYVAHVQNRSITDLTGLEAFYHMERFDCSHNQITTVVIPNSLQGLEALDCSYNQIESITGNTDYIKYLDASHNELTILPNLFNVYQLYVDYNKLIYLTPEIFSSTLWELHCSNNQLIELTITSDMHLGILRCNNNKLPSLILTAQSSLHDLDCSNNQLSYLHIRNENNSDFTYFKATENPSLTCIEVDDVVYSEANWRDDVDPSVSFNTNCGDPTVVYIPDANLKAFMLQNYDGSTTSWGGDGEIQHHEAEQPFQLNITNLGIADLTGMEAFSNLEFINCSDNQITDLSPLPGRLNGLFCNNNQITSLNGNFEYLTYLRASHNKISSFPSTLQNIVDLDIDYNELTTLDISNPRLQRLVCSYNQLTSLTLASGSELYLVYCNNNKLKSLDLSDINNLAYLDCSNNELIALNVKNGKNQQIGIFKVPGNPDLTCIEVDDADYSEANWRGNVDPTASFSTNCADPAARIESITVYPNPTTDKVFIKSVQPINEVQVFDMIYSGLKSTQYGNEIDLSSLHKGVYNLKIKQGGNVTSVRIIKE